MGLFSGKRPDTLGAKDGRLAPCPTLPNCVTSQGDAHDAVHHVAALVFSGTPAAAWTALEDAVRGMERATVVTTREGYLHAQFESRLLGFVDDLECVLDPAAKVIHVRSASRVGYSDLGVNRDRVEALRARFQG